ncbi:MAG: hypothetical protein J5I91_02290 [Bacteroidetes bacterium]|nr:hypothetical protein [Bacteroidota bacterium]
MTLNLPLFSVLFSLPEKINSGLAQESATNTELSKRFEHLKRLFVNLPLSEKEKAKWVELRRDKKILSLIALHNPGLRESLQKYTFNTNQEETLPVSRESQSFETILGNLNTFINQNKHASFVEFLTLGKKSNMASTLNLFSVSKEENSFHLKEKDIITIREIENQLKEQTDIADKIWSSFLVFKQLTESKSGLKKHGCMFAEYILKDDERNLLNFPLLLWEAYNNTKVHKEKTYSGRRTPITGFEEITREIFLETAIKLIEGNTQNLVTYFKKQIHFESLDIESKIRVNFLIDREFRLPNKIYENGFSKSNALLKSLCIHGGLRKDDLKKEGALLLAELLEAESFITKSQDSNIEWVINISYNSKPLKFSKYNNLSLALVSQKENESNDIKEESMIKNSLENSVVTEFKPTMHNLFAQ